MGWKDYQQRTAKFIADTLELTEEQRKEFQALSLWGVRHGMNDEQLIWVAEAFPEYFEIKEEVFDMKDFESAFKIYEDEYNNTESK